MVSTQSTDISEAHLESCLEAGIELTGTNAEVHLDSGNISALEKELRLAMIFG